jgi:hypothetical protein
MIKSIQHFSDSVPIALQVQHQNHQDILSNYQEQASFPTSFSAFSLSLEPQGSLSYLVFL